jgi:hypothetical protein
MLGAWHDVAWYQRSLQAERAEPEPPRGVRALLGTAAWKRALDAGLASYPA